MDQKEERDILKSYTQLSFFSFSMFFFFAVFCMQTSLDTVYIAVEQSREDLLMQM